MKNQFKIVTITLLLTILSYGQGGRTVTLDYSDMTMPGRRYAPEPLETQGSPYINKVFSHAKVGSVIENAYLRYNAHKDEFEFINSANDTLVLNKTEVFDNITFTATNTKYQLLSYTTKNGQLTTGYLIRLHENNNFILYKKQKVNFTAARPSKSSYDAASPPKFTVADDVFYLKSKDQEIFEFPSNKKGLLKLYPEKKEAIESFLKENKVNFDKDADLIKLVNFLST